MSMRSQLTALAKEKLAAQAKFVPLNASVTLACQANFCRVRRAVLSGKHAFPSLVHKSLQAPHDKPNARKPTVSTSNFLDSVNKSSPKNTPQQRLSASSAAAATPELKRPIILDALDEILKPTSQGDIGLGRRDRVVNLGRSMYVPAELIAQKIRKRFWYRM
ncbi:hypothetical protein NA57DRAFT_56524 [Rhizodiscina lignyota]|uniref:Uncharacterized protein n=1 Tax=Rhizodiscina lignyota TaxID=1504668 RepID=A0A9P4IBL2_9PEZI|nr:hypothetical protein NA57DRAFT_56524 [Rhizodiscina lignyota]